MSKVTTHRTILHLLIAAAREGVTAAVRDDPSDPQTRALLATLNEIGDDDVPDLLKELINHDHQTSYPDNGGSHTHEISGMGIYWPQRSR